MQTDRSRLLGDLIERLPDDTKRISLLYHLRERAGEASIVDLIEALGLSPTEGAQVLDGAANDRLIRIVSGAAGHIAMLTGFGRDVLAQSENDGSLARAPAQSRSAA